MSETTERHVSLYGRLADELTRDVVSGRTLEAFLTPGGQHALRKDDGYFVFPNLAVSATAYQITVEAGSYQSRTLSVSLLTPAAVEVRYPGEDELFVLVTAANSTNQQVTFQSVPFVPTIRAGSAVIGPGGFTAILGEPVEGSDVSFATLNSVGTLVAPALLRIVRSANLILSPGPYQQFEPDATLIALKAVENTAGDPPIGGALIALDQVNSVAITTTAIQGVNLHTVALPGPSDLLLGTDRAIQTRTNERGDAIFYLPSDTPVTEVRLQVSRTGYVSVTQTVAVTPGSRTSSTIRLNRL